MKILVDIGHPAHVHYMKNFIQMMKSKGHTFIVMAKKKEVTFELLESFGIQYFKRFGKNNNNILGNALGLIKTEFELFKFAKAHNPDVFFGPASAHMSHVAKLLDKPFIGFDDTEHAFINQRLYLPFIEKVLTPTSFKKFFGGAHYNFWNKSIRSKI